MNLVIYEVPVSFQGKYWVPVSFQGLVLLLHVNLHVLKILMGWQL